MANRTMTHDRMKTLRMRLCTRFPFLSLVAYRCRFEETPGLGTFGTDTSWRIYYDPVVPWDDEEALGALWHEIAGHILGDHGHRGDGKERGPWLIATDCAINTALPTGLKLPRGVVYPEGLGMPPGGIAETYYNTLMKNAPRLVTGKCAGGSGATGKQEKWEKAPDGAQGAKKDLGDVRAHAAGQEKVPPDQVAGEGPSQEEKDDLRRQVAVRILGSAPGTVPGTVEDWAREYLYGHKTDYGSKLACAVRRALAWKAGAVDYTWTRPNRRQCMAPGGVPLPALRRPVPRVGIVLDTSGSMDDPKYNRAAGEVKWVGESVGVPCTLLGTDVHVHSITVLQPGRGIPKMKRGGGTDMGAGIVGALELKPPAEIIVVITDGETPWPLAPPVPVIIGLVTRDGAHNHQTPGWATTVVL